MQAEKLLKKLYATKRLHDATVARKLTALEQAIDAVKKGGWEKDLHQEMHDANILLEKVRDERLEHLSGNSILILTVITPTNLDIHLKVLAFCRK